MSDDNEADELSGVRELPNVFAEAAAMQRKLMAAMKAARRPAGKKQWVFVATPAHFMGVKHTRGVMRDRQRPSRAVIAGAWEWTPETRERFKCWVADEVALMCVGSPLVEDRSVWHKGGAMVDPETGEVEW